MATLPRSNTLDFFIHPEVDHNCLVAKSDRYSLVFVGDSRSQLRESIQEGMRLACPFGLLPALHYCLAIIDCPAELVDPGPAEDLYMILEDDEQGYHARTLDSLVQIRQLSDNTEELVSRLKAWADRGDHFSYRIKRILLFLQ